MNRKQVLAAVIGVGAVTTGAAAQDAVQWRVEDGGNGHWYQLVLPAVRIDAVEASLAAHTRNGELTSIESSAENDFVFQLAGADPTRWTLAWPGATQITGPWIGASYSGGTWGWLDGAPWGFTNWAPSEPNYLFEETAVLFMGGASGPPTNRWNNLRPDYLNWGYIIEWSADCNSDGIVDYGQILFGELEDTNSNGVPDCCDAGTSCDCPADIDGNGDINGIDLAIILDKWGTNGGKDYPNADIDGDGTIAGADLAQVLGNWGACQ
jgi:hypothetical protein